MTPGHNIEDSPECLSDPGELTSERAILTLCVHHSCPASCRWRERALRTLDPSASTDGTATATPSDELDRQLAARIREYLCRKDRMVGR